MIGDGDKVWGLQGTEGNHDDARDQMEAETESSETIRSGAILTDLGSGGAHSYPSNSDTTIINIQTTSMIGDGDRLLGLTGTEGNHNDEVEAEIVVSDGMMTDLGSGSWSGSGDSNSSSSDRKVILPSGWWDPQGHYTRVEGCSPNLQLGEGVFPNSMWCTGDLSREEVDQERDEASVQERLAIQGMPGLEDKEARSAFSETSVLLDPDTKDGNNSHLEESQRRDQGKQHQGDAVELYPNGLSSLTIRRSRVHFLQAKKGCKERWNSGVEMGTKWTILPEELVEKIISMMPFPSIFTARVLNMRWRSNFIPTSSSVFQKQVNYVSSKWKHYCPVILNIEEEWLMGFDQENNQWEKIRIGFEREGLSNWFSTHKLRGGGALMCGISNRSNIFITNVLTKKWRWLPAQPLMGQTMEIHLLPIGYDAYQVLLMTKLDKQNAEICCQVYDSRYQSWTMKQSTISAALFSSSTAYLDGVIYVMEYDLDDHNDIMKLLSYNVEAGIWTSIPHPFGSMLHEIETYELLICQCQVMVVIRLHPAWWTKVGPVHNTHRNTLMVYRLDPITLDLREVSRGPPETINGASSTLFASDNHCIYFGNPQVQKSIVLVLDMRSREWSCLPPPLSVDGSFRNKWATFSFQPGLNPFALV